MSLLNFSAPYLATPPPLTTQYYPQQPPPLPQPPQEQQGPYSYPAPANPFLGEEYPPPSQPPTYTRVNAGSGKNTKVHAVVDYDYYDELEGPDGPPAVTPIQGPILLKNGTVPVVPLYSYPVLNNGSFVQIPVSFLLFFFLLLFTNFSFAAVNVVNTQG